MACKKYNCSHRKYPYRCCYHETVIVRDNEGPVYGTFIKQLTCDAYESRTDSSDCSQNRVLNWDDIPADGLPDGYLARREYSDTIAYCNKHIVRCAYCPRWIPLDPYCDVACFYAECILARRCNNVTK